MDHNIFVDASDEVCFDDVLWGGCLMFFDFNSHFDLAGNIRYADEPTTINTGSDVLAFLDMGDCEFQVRP